MKIKRILYSTMFISTLPFNAIGEEIGSVKSDLKLYNGYIHDPISGKDWLQFEYTDGLSYYEVGKLISSGSLPKPNNWQIASSAEVVDLLTNTIGRQPDQNLDGGFLNRGWSTTNEPLIKLSEAIGYTVGTTIVGMVSDGMPTKENTISTPKAVTISWSPYSRYENKAFFLRKNSAYGITNLEKNFMVGTWVYRDKKED